jgi:hypothetical protein
LLMHGNAALKDFKFSISADDLPPIIGCVPLPADLVERGVEREFEWAPLAIGLAFVLFGSGVAALVTVQRPLFILCKNIGYWICFPDHWLAITSSILTVVPALLLLVAGPMLILAAFGDFDFAIPRRHRFRIPQGFHRPHAYIVRMSEFPPDVVQDERKK